MPISGLDQKEFDRQFTPNGFRKDEQGKPDKLDYSYFRERLGFLIHELDQLEKLMQTKESQAAPGREGITPESIAEMRAEFYETQRQLTSEALASEKNRLGASIERLREMMKKAHENLKLPEDVKHRREMNNEITLIDGLDQRLQSFMEDCQQFQEFFEDDTVVGDFDESIQMDLLKERAKYYKPQK